MVCVKTEKGIKGSFVCQLHLITQNPQPAPLSRRPECGGRGASGSITGCISGVKVRGSPPLLPRVRVNRCPSAIWGLRKGTRPPELWFSQKSREVLSHSQGWCQPWCADQGPTAYGELDRLSGGSGRSGGSSGSRVSGCAVGDTDSRTPVGTGGRIKPGSPPPCKPHPLPGTPGQNLGRWVAGPTRAQDAERCGMSRRHAGPQECSLTSIPPGPFLGAE